MRLASRLATTVNFHLNLLMFLEQFSSKNGFSVPSADTLLFPFPKNVKTLVFSPIQISDVKKI